MRKPIAIVAAMPEERDALLTLFREHAVRTHFHTVLHETRLGNQEVVVALSGVGKTNAACTLALLLSDFDVGCVINIGSAGGLQPGQKILDLVVPQEVTYTDVDITSFGFAFGQMYGEPPRFRPDPRLLALLDDIVAAGGLAHACHRGLLGSGDAHITRPDQITLIRERFNNEVLCVEMEGGAIAHVCTRFGIPFLILRAISDLPGTGDSTLDFRTFLKQASAMSARLCVALVERLGKIEHLQRPPSS